MSLNHYSSALARTLFGSAALSLALLAPSVALGVDTKTYLGTACTPAEGDQASTFLTFDGVIFASAGGSTANQEVNCPIVKSVFDNTTLSRVDVYVDLGSSGTVTCDLTVHNANFNDRNTHNPLIPMQTQIVSGSGQKVLPPFLNFGAGIGGPWQSDWRYYQLKCKLSHNTSIRSYKVAEAGTTEDSRKIYPSSMCRVDELSTTGRWAYDYSWVQVGADGLGQEVAFVCPLITDRTGNTGGLSVAEMIVTPPLSPDIAPVVCTLYSSDNFFGVVDQASASAPGISPTGDPSKLLTFATIDMSRTWAVPHPLRHASQRGLENRQLPGQREIADFAPNLCQGNTNGTEALL